MDSKMKSEFSIGDRVEIIGGAFYDGKHGEIIDMRYDSLSDQFVYDVLPSFGSRIVRRYGLSLKLIESRGCKSDVSIDALMEVLNAKV